MAARARQDGEIEAWHPFAVDTASHFVTQAWRGGVQRVEQDTVGDFVGGPVTMNEDQQVMRIGRGNHLRDAGTLQRQGVFGPADRECAMDLGAQLAEFTTVRTAASQACFASGGWVPAGIAAVVRCVGTGEA